MAAQQGGFLMPTSCFRTNSPKQGMGRPLLTGLWGMIRGEGVRYKKKETECQRPVLHSRVNGCISVQMKSTDGMHIEGQSTVRPRSIAGQKNRQQKTDSRKQTAG